MRNVFLLLSVFLAACSSSSSSSPTAPSSSTDAALTQAQTQANSSAASLDVAFTKWIITPEGAMAGVTSLAGVDGLYTGEVTGINQINDGLGQIQATYNVNVGGVVFSADIDGKQNQTGRGVLNGIIQTGSYAGARVHVEYQQTATGCPTLGIDGFCYIGTVQVMTGSARNAVQYRTTPTLVWKPFHRRRCSSRPVVLRIPAQPTRLVPKLGWFAMWSGRPSCDPPKTADTRLHLRSLKSGLLLYPSEVMILGSDGRGRGWSTTCGKFRWTCTT